MVVRPGARLRSVVCATEVVVVDATGAIELLCSRAGDRSLAVGGVAAAVNEAKPLPSSD